MFRRHRLAAAAALAALPLLIPAAAPAAKKKPAKPKPAATARFEVLRVDIRGERTSRYDEGETVYDYRGIARYETSVDNDAALVIPPPAKRRLPTTVVIRGLEYNGLSDAKITTLTGVDDCSMEAEGAWAPESLPIVVAFRGQQMHVNWQLVAPGIRCPADALEWSIPQTQPRALLRTYKLSSLLKVRRGRQTRLPVKIAAKWNHSGSAESVRWSGYVQLKRLR
ncbi:hypothetical protein [Conexibacter arvalis]|uniref:Uncharacterized protein n=1 Tax=Conexibacter arvalis TaxID=912552 RepID=A0A840IEC2_9ACTN|nr:hypothetical protein [Conexibacter arvalis]MBB4663179.1 hypothetical protein [Conexibacter arvalis]